MADQATDGLTRADLDAQAAARQEKLREDADMGAQRLAGYGTYRAWYGGEHGVPLSDRQEAYLRNGHDVAWCENFCETIVDAMISRMAVDGWETTLDTDTDSEKAAGEAAGQLDEWWDADTMGVTETVLYEETAVCGDGFLIASWDTDENRPRWQYNRPELVKAVYDPDTPDRMLYAVKVWAASWEGVSIRRMNLFYPDRIEKWFTLSSSEDGQDIWMPYLDADDYTDTGTVNWPIPWVDSTGQPLGIPVIHFRNRPDSTGYGRSELRGAIPLNAGLNKLILDLFDVADYAGWPFRYGTGIEGDFNPSTAPGRFMKTGDKDARFGQLDAADPGPILEAIQAQLRRLAAKTRTPIHDLVDSGGQRSGEALKSAEAPLVKRVQDRTVPHTASWSQAATIAFRLANTFGNTDIPPVESASPCWDSAETRDTLVEVNTATIKHDLGVSKHTLLTELGYDPEKEAELRKTEAQESMEAAGGAFDRGMFPGPGARVPTEPSEQNPPVGSEVE